MTLKRKKTISKGKPSPKASPIAPIDSAGLWKFFLPVMAATFLLFLPALKNGFTNWDDILYVTQNPLLKSLNAEGLKAIFSTPVVSNYHPLTILSLALNYQFAELTPSTYHLTSMVLHTINTGLVFWFIFLLSSGNRWVSVVVALLFGIHPMHVESVAWISERKDLLYTLFYAASMISYVKYVRNAQARYLVLTTLLGALSLLCKPAAIVLPMSLLLVDFYLRRNWSPRWITEKIPLFLLSAVMAYVTFAIQSEKAVASVEAHNFVDRICYAGFGWVWYILKAIVPIPLSGLHPFPKELTPPYYIATAVSLLALAYIALKVRNRNLLFGWGFYTVNLLLVLQLVSIGNAVVAERYTYVPYIGLFFWAAMSVYPLLDGVLSKFKWIVVALAGLWIAILGMITYQRIPVWQSSQVFWQDVLDQYPDSPRAWTNKGLDYFDQKKWTDAIFHLSKALVIDSTYANALEWRTRTSMEVGEYDRALKDILRYNRHYPGREDGEFLLARAYAYVDQTDKALDLYGQLIAKYGKPDYYNNRGVILFNKLRRYQEATADFEAAIRLNPNNAGYYLNLSRCYYVSNDINSARKFGLKAKELGEQIEPNYAKAIGVQ